MKTAGIIGGFGPTTTSEFSLKVVSSVMVKGGNIRPEIIIWNAPVDQNFEVDFITQNQSHQHFRVLVARGAQKLKNSGADFLVLPCNSLHIFIKEIEKIGLPTLNVIEETKNFLVEKNIKQIGLLATSATIKNNLFSSLNPICPSFNDQTKLDQIILNLINNKATKNDEASLQEIIKNLKASGATHIPLGCTDLQHLCIKGGESIIDTLDLLVQATIKEISGNI